MSKPRKSKAFIRRSKASKKGWATRRKNAEAKAGIRQHLEEHGLGKLRKHIAGLTPEQAKKKISAEKKLLKQASKKKIPKEKREKLKTIYELWNTFVTDADEAEIRTDGSIALNRSELRLLPHVQKEKLLERMNEAYEDEDFDLFMYDIADEYEVEVREVYTFFFSP